MPNAFARCTTSCPMFPVPTTPRVLPASSRPAEYFFFSHLPPRVLCEASGIERGSESSSATVCSAPETLLPPGAFITTTPRRVAAARSMLSTPVPARPITRSFVAAASTSAVTLVALRTASASYWAITCSSSAAFMPGLKSTCAPGMRSRMLFASGERSSEMRMRITLGNSCERTLCRGESLAQLDLRSQIVQPALDRADDHQHVEIVEVPEVRDAEDLPLGRVLPSDQLDPVFGEEVLHQLLAVDALGRDHRRHRRRRALRKEIEPERQHARARGLRHPLVAREDRVQALLAIHLQGLVEPLDQRDGRCPRGLILLLVVALALDVEVEARQVGGLLSPPPLGARGDGSDTRRQAERFVARAHQNVDAPPVHRQRHGAHRRDGGAPHDGGRPRGPLRE